jgi:hypothetical protein
MATRRRTPPPEPPWQVILEDIRSQNLTTLEAVHSSHLSLRAQIADVDERLGGRLTIVENVVRQNSADIRELKADVGGLKADVGGLKADVGVLKTDVAGLKVAVADLRAGLERVEGKVDGLTPLEARVTALERSR